jgi:pSer/pThr/pTyr-binding forkhead associated (FHA) protein
VDDRLVSRTHARLDCAESGCTLMDLDSANGCLVNGQRVTRAQLAPGDLVRVGDSVFRYEVGWEPDAPEFEQIDNEAELSQTVAFQTVAMTINDTSRARIVVHQAEKTWEFPLQTDLVRIGRQGDHDVWIDHPKVSRSHAQIERRGQSWVIRDLGSTNGTWLGTAAIEEHTLQPGDTLQVGPARLVFKAGFQPVDLTLVEDPLATPRVRSRRIPVVIVPGLMGSELWLGQERVWPNVRYLFTQPEMFMLPGEAPLEPREIVNQVVIVPNLIKLEQYGRLGDFLVENLGYRRGVDLMEFAYDWRQDVRLSARRLGQAIEAWEIDGPVVLIAHSLGSLVSRYYVERLGGKGRVERVIFLGGPHYGVPKAVANLIRKVDLLPLGLMGDRLRQVLTSFPSLYQILPIYPCATDQHGVSISVFDDDSWLPDENRPHLEAARQFRHEVGRRLSVPSVSIFGYGLKTVHRLEVQRSATGEWTSLDMLIADNGDSTIPEASTVLEGSEIHPVHQYHGSLYIDNDVKMRLKLELTGQNRRA